MQDNNTLGLINQYAMRQGIVLGLYGTATLAAFCMSLYAPLAGILFELMLLASPFMSGYLTFSFRRKTVGRDGAFGFSRGFFHALLTGFYASLWVALAVFVYLQYFDHGALFQAYAKTVSTPEAQAYLKQTGLDAQLSEMTEGKGAEGVADMMQSIGAATWSALFLYLPFIVGPFISVIVGLVCRRK